MLHTAASSGNLAVVRELLARRVDPNPRLPDGRSPRPIPLLKRHEHHSETYVTYTRNPEIFMAELRPNMTE